MYKARVLARDQAKNRRQSQNYRALPIWRLGILWVRHCVARYGEPRSMVSPRSAAGGETGWMFVPPGRGVPARNVSSIKGLLSRERTVCTGTPPPHRTYIGVVPPPAPLRGGTERNSAHHCVTRIDAPTRCPASI